jgi:uncharacterized protein YecT (DUF1311 family)
MKTRNLALFCVCSAVIALSTTKPALIAQQKELTPQQKAYRDYEARRSILQAQGKQILDAEAAREKAGDCPDAQTDEDFNSCFGKQVTIADQHLASFESVIRGLQAPTPGDSENGSTGIAGPVLTPAQFLTEFDQLEESWRRYRGQACTAAFHQFEGGTGGPSFEMQCKLQLTRDHIRELNMIYGEDLHM